MKVLFIGGNGNISWYCTKKSIEKGHEVYALNREVTVSTRRNFPAEVIKLKGDIRNASEIKDLLKSFTFDVICDFICFNQEHAQTAIDIFQAKTNQYVFVSSEAVYQRKSKYLPFKENCPKYDADSSCEYIKGKIKAEETFLKAYYHHDFPVTIVRPGYTYDTIMPVSIGQNCFTAPSRFLNGKPILIAGDGNNLWTFTHSNDFANAFVELIGNKDAIGDDFHITSDEWLTWNEATEILLQELGVKNHKFIHIPFDEAMKTEFAAQKEMMFQKMWHNIYDNSKIKKISPNWQAKTSFAEGIKQTIIWLYENDAHRRIDKQLDEKLEKLTQKYIERII